MKEYTISENDEGRRFDKYIMNILKNAPSSFTYKMLRKKNIVLNDKKASGTETLRTGDNVKIYLSDETFEKFSKRDVGDHSLINLMPPVVYEDSDILIVNKPSGMLTQKSDPSDVSLNEICLSYVCDSTDNDNVSDASFRPSVCNRLDRNTSGLVTFAKTYRAARNLSEAFRNRTIHKYYKCVVKGIISEDMELTGTLIKDETTNKVTVGSADKNGSYIDTRIHPLYQGEDLSYVEVMLITGKTHQIRAHLAYAGHPILGDPKYGDRLLNEKYKKSHGIDSQMLVCYKLVIPDDFPISSIAGKTFSIDDDLMKVM